MNVQTIPRSDKVVKRGFVPKRDAFLFFDYKQIEYRMLAFYLAGKPMRDESMAEVFRRGEDVHAATAAALFNKPIADVTEAERDIGKTFNFLTIYGGGAKKAAHDLGIPLKQAQALQDEFYRAWPAVKKFHNPPFRDGGYRRGEGPGALQRVLEERGYIKTLWGRHLHPRKPHAALNTLVQGCSADLMRWAMVQVHQAMKDEDLESSIVNVVHDELMLDVLDDETEWIVENVPKLMIPDLVNKVVPVEVDTEYSRTNWAEKEAYPGVDGRAHDLARA